MMWEAEAAHGVASERGRAAPPESGSGMRPRSMLVWLESRSAKVGQRLNCLAHRAACRRIVGHTAEEQVGGGMVGAESRRMGSGGALWVAGLGKSETWMQGLMRRRGRSVTGTRNKQG